MLPSYREGDYVISLSPRLAGFRKGDVIIFEHHFYGHLIKQIEEKASNGYYVRGTHPMSTGSEAIGLVSPDMIKGKVVMKIRPD